MKLLLIYWEEADGSFDFARAFDIWNEHLYGHGGFRKSQYVADGWVGKAFMIIKKWELIRIFVSPKEGFLYVSAGYQFALHKYNGQRCN